MKAVCTGKMWLLTQFHFHSNNMMSCLRYIKIDSHEVCSKDETCRLS